MAVPITVGGQIVVLPSQSDKFAWGTAVTSALVLLAANSIQTTGGLFTLTAELDLGASFGLKALYYKSRTTNPAAAGQVRLANVDSINFRNQANGADLAFGPGNGSTTPIDQAQWNGVQITGNPKCVAAAPGTQSGVTTAVVVNFSATTVDTDTAFTTGASAHFQVPSTKGGFYVMSGMLEVLTAGGTGTPVAILRKNAAAQYNIQATSVAAATTIQIPFCGIVNAASGDSLDVTVAQNTAGTLTVTANTRLCVFRIV